MSRPGTTRVASTNLGSGDGFRVLEGKLALVTGASRGIGAATCENLASKGCSLIMNYTSDSSSEKTQKLAERLQGDYGIQCLPVQADMGSESGPQYIVDIAKNRFAHQKSGRFQVDIIINNAGIAGNKSIEESDIELFTSMYNVNVRGPLLLIKAAMAYLPTDRSGRIVNVSSVSASLGFHKQSVYGGTKAALEAMTRTWSRELAERATCNAVNPGPVATDMYGGTDETFQKQMANWTRSTPLAAVRPGIDRQDFVDTADFNGGRPAYDHEVAGVIAMLCTPDSGWCTGSVVCCNGGFRFSV
ncbi:NAD(P)-binding protein [Polychaeton citri CBS 116435]|uniref:NAD(P)-binding protein n=1 Tax=Polychaeton citri CBS 116435 TaxID=1314669 RepID=A0A9P4QB58_9PEZI|nr:NAD(P)-binding protein [Polychaeton citri CBS 116435]